MALNNRKSSSVMCFKSTFIEPLRFRQISLLITFYSSPSFKEIANYSKIHPQRSSDLQPNDLKAHLTKTKKYKKTLKCCSQSGRQDGWGRGIYLVNEEPTGQMIGIKYLIYAFLDSFRMFHLWIYFNLIIHNNRV